MLNKKIFFSGHFPRPRPEPGAGSPEAVQDDDQHGDRQHHPVPGRLLREPALQRLLQPEEGGRNGTLQSAKKQSASH